MIQPFAFYPFRLPESAHIYFFFAVLATFAAGLAGFSAGLAVV
jgi:hypothetical protein